MTSLSFSGEHMAWVQRVRRERASRLNFTDVYNNSVGQELGLPEYIFRPIVGRKAVSSAMGQPYSKYSLCKSPRKPAEKSRRHSELVSFSSSDTRDFGMEPIVEGSNERRRLRHSSAIDKRSEYLKGEAISEHTGDKLEALKIARLIKIEKLKRLIIQKQPRYESA